MAAESGTAPREQRPAGNPTDVSELQGHLARLQDSDFPQIADQLADQFASTLERVKDLTRRSSIPADQLTHELALVLNAITVASQQHGPPDIPAHIRAQVLLVMTLPKDLVRHLITTPRLEAAEELPEPLPAIPTSPPPGWLTNTVGYWEPDPNHPDYPDKFKASGRAVEDDEQNLDEDPRVAIVVDKLNATLGPLQARFLSWGEYSANLYWDDTYEQIMLSITGATAEVTERAGNIAPPHVVMAYLVQRTILPDVAHKLGIRWQQAAPVWLRFIPSLNEFVMRFSDATQTERRQFNPLINELQIQIGYLKPRPGRNDLKREDAPPGERARTAAKLALWAGYTNEMIAEFFGWTPAANDQSEEAKRHRAKQAERAGGYVNAGIELLTAEQGPSWKQEVPRLHKDRVLRIRNKGAKHRRRGTQEHVGHDPSA